MINTLKCGIGISMFTIAFLFLLKPLSAQQVAFPGAEGAGKFTSGGRGTTATPTTVYEVTNLTDDNTIGSLRYALTQTAAFRTVVFRISGTIRLNSPLTIRANTTIAGQTAPGDGIAIADYPVTIGGDNVIVRYIRFRLGDRHQQARNGNDDALGSSGRKNIILDHCTMSWSNDEALSVYGGDSTTLQWNILSEPLNFSYHDEGTGIQNHGYGGIWGGRKMSAHHNLIAHVQGRAPRFDGSRNLAPANTPGLENVDYRNNVIYNWASYNVNGGEGGNYNIVNNYYKYGPNTSNGSSAGVSVKFMVMNPSKSSTLPYPKIYLSGNYVDGSATITQNNWRGVAMSGGSLADTVQSKVTSPFPVSDITTHTAIEAYDLVLKYAGVVLPKRDTLDERIANDVRNRTGKIIDVQGGYPRNTPFAQTINAWPTLQSTTPPADTDKDGMPDAWEVEFGLNSNNAADRAVIAPNGYTQLENYLNSLATDAIITKSALNNFNQSIGTPSAVQTYTLSGQNLTGDITIVPPVGYEVSINSGVSWSNNASPLVVNATNGIITPKTVSVRLNASATGTHSGTITHIAHLGGFINLSVTGSASTATALPSINLNEGFAIFPNPAAHFIVLQHPVTVQQASVEVFSIDGKKLKSIPIKQATDRTIIPVSDLTDGNYFIQYISKNKRVTLGFMKGR